MKKSVSTIISIIMYIFSLGLIIIGRHIKSGYDALWLLSDSERAYLDDVDIRWFLGPYSGVLIFVAVILILIATYILFVTYKKSKLKVK